MTQSPDPRVPSSVRAIFDQALEMESAEGRLAYLAQACADNPQLREDVETLLSAHAAAASFLESPVIGPRVDLDPPIVLTPPGTVIGHYKLLEPIGEGGYGVVFMAEQTSPVQRKVALKIIKAGMDTRQVIARFEAERQALALMDHPNIAKVFDAGTTDAGRPYFVMELVKGMPITKYCDAHHVEPRQRLELFMQVCHAVQHAHQKGIIHRDLKPSNVLVALYDGKPVPKVIDFGVAKATGQQLTELTMFTGFGDVIGTLEYMSPEQAEVNQLDIDTRSDIYSLGVLLYELLTGTTPLERHRVMKAGMLEMLRVVREEEPPRPSTRLSTSEQLPSIAANRGLEPRKLSGLVHGELDWIVMKALEKDRNRRYETASGFATDVRRYLADEAVQACPPSTMYRFRKFARRNKARLAGASLLVVALLIAASGIGWAVRDRSARQAEAARQRQERQAKVAAQVELILGDVDDLATRQRWPEALAALRRAAAVVAGGDADDATAERVRQGLKAVELTPTIGDAHKALYELLHDQGKLDEAIAVLRKAVEIDPKSAEAQDNLGAALRNDLKDYEKAAECFRKAIELNPRNAKYWVHLSYALHDQRKLDESIAACRKAIEIDPNSKDASAAYFRLAKVLEDQKKPDEAIVCFRKATEVNPNYSLAHTCLAWLLTNCWDAKVRDVSGGLEAARKAVEVAPQSSIAWEVLGWARYRAGDFKGSIETLEKSCALQHDPTGGNSFQWFFLAMAYWQLGEKDTAREWYDKAVKWMDASNEKGSGDLIRFRTEAGELLKTASTYPATKAAN